MLVALQPAAMASHLLPLLTVSVHAGHTECVAYLLKRRANPAAANKQGKTAADVARGEEVKALLAAALEAAQADRLQEATAAPEPESATAQPQSNARKRPAEGEAEQAPAEAAAAAEQQEQTFNPNKRLAGVQLQDEDE